MFKDVEGSCSSQDAPKMRSMFKRGKNKMKRKFIGRSIRDFLVTIKFLTGFLGVLRRDCCCASSILIDVDFGSGRKSCI